MSSSLTEFQTAAELYENQNDTPASEDEDVLEGINVDALRPETDRDDGPDYTRHYEPEEQGGYEYVRCSRCGRELLTIYGGRRKLPHTLECPIGGDRA